jgi:hypothetical protein
LRAVGTDDETRAAAGCRRARVLQSGQLCRLDGGGQIVLGMLGVGSNQSTTGQAPGVARAVLCRQMERTVNSLPSAGIR